LRSGQHHLRPYIAPNLYFLPNSITEINLRGKRLARRVFCMGRKEMATEFSDILKRINNVIVQRLSVNEGTILKCISKKQGLRICTTFFWLRICSNDYFVNKNWVFTYWLRDYRLLNKGFGPRSSSIRRTANLHLPFNLRTLPRTNWCTLFLEKIIMFSYVFPLLSP
jgi:hypothetical protein